jgi:TRAP-type mannitol/chloroaromatic compound transport system permease small subunit
MQPFAILKKLMGLVDKLSIFLGRVAMGLVVVLVGAMLFEVVSRRVFDSPTIWAFDFSYMINGTVYLGAAGYALLQNEHIRIDFFSARLSLRAQHSVNFVFYVFLFLPTMFIICQAAIGDAYEALVTGQVERVSPWAPVIWPYYTAISVGLCVLFLQSTVQTIRHLIGIAQPTSLALVAMDSGGE